MWTRNYNFNGHIYVKLKDNKFTLEPSIADRQIAVIFDYSADKYNVKKLSVTMNKDKNVSTKIIMSVISTDLLHTELKILEFTFESPSFSIEVLGTVHKDYQKTIHIFGTYSLKSDEKVVEAVFNIYNSKTISMLCRTEQTVYDAYRWLCSLWRLSGQNGLHCISVDFRVIEESLIMADCSSGVTVNFDVSEKLLCSPITKDRSAVTVPWNEDVVVITQYLSVILQTKRDQVCLLDRESRVLNVATELCVDDHRADEWHCPHLLYDIIGVTVHCRSLVDRECVLNVMLVGQQTVHEVKERLAFKMGADRRRLLICRQLCPLANDERVSTNEMLGFCLGSAPPIVATKDQVGRGGFGAVFRCTDSTGRTFALKEFGRQMGRAARCSVVREMVAMASVAVHGNVVHLLDRFVDEEHLSIGMEYMEAGSLADYLVKRGALDEPCVRHFALGIVRGLAHVHHSGVCHGDIKAANVLLTTDGVAKLCDFGQSTVVANSGVSQSDRYGTLRFMAPEVLRGAQTDCRSDVWSVGATVVQMVTGGVTVCVCVIWCSLGRAPLDHIGDKEAAEVVRSTGSLPYTPGRPLSQALTLLLDVCLQAEPADRPSCDDLLALPFLGDESALVT